MRRRGVRRGLWSATAGGLAIVAIFFNHPAQRPAPQVFHGAHAAVDVVGYSSNGTLIDGTLAVRMLS